MRNTALILVVLLCQAAAAAAQVPERVMTLEESVSFGVQNSQELLAIQEQLSLAQQRVDEASSLKYPKIDFNLSASRYQSGLPIVLPPSFNSSYLPENLNQYYATRFTLWQYLYAGGRYTTSLRLAETNLSQTRNEADVVRNRVIREIKTAFYDCLFMREKIKAYEETLALKGPDAAAGPELTFELTRARHEYEKARLALVDVMDIELNTAVEIEGQLSPPSAVYDLNKCLAWAMRYRPELSQTQFQEALDSLRLSLSLAERYPTVTLGVNYELSGERLPLDQENWSATVNLNVPVFDGWASWARIRQRKFRLRESKIQRAEIEDRVRYEVRDAFLDYDFWRGMVAPASSLIAAAKEPVRKLSATLTYLDTLREAIRAQLRLEWAIGKPLSESLPSGSPEK